MKYEEVMQMTPQEVALLCEQHIGKTYPYEDLLQYKHGRAKEMKVADVRIRYNIGGRATRVDVYNILTFEDGYEGDYVMSGEGFLTEYHK